MNLKMELEFGSEVEC